MKKILLFLISILFLLDIKALEKPDLHLSYDNVKISDSSFQCNLLVKLPKEWKLAKVPSISILKSKNLKNFMYSNECIEKLNDTTYKVNFQITIEDIKIAENELIFSISCPICRDICTIVSKDVAIHFDYSIPNTKARNLLLTIVFAFIGGLILNIMPCVLPVIMMKLQSLVVSNNKTAIIGSITGNYLSFFIFAVFLTILKLSGEQVGWGMHFQNIIFLKSVVAILFFFVLYSFGIFSISPSMQLKNESRQIFIKNCISSIIAAIVAIPCTAPFLGTAAAFAIQGSIREMLIIFFVIATGFSMPYLLALIFPITIPRTLGKFSNTTKTIINFGILITFLWVFFLLCNHLNIEMIILYCIAFAICTLLFKKGHDLFAVLLIAAVSIIPNNEKDSYIGNHNQSLWEKYEDIKSILNIINNHVTKGKIVILNISADWCLTCKYNKINVLNNKQIVQTIKDKNIICIEGDITKKNDSLMRFINSHDRAGIPFIMIYGSKAKDGILLSEIPSIDEVLNAIKKVE